MEVDSMNTNQYTQKTLEALQAAQQLAVEYQHNALEPEPAFLKNPHLRVLFIYILFVFPVILTFSFFLPEDIPNTFSNLIPENFYL